MKRFLVFLLFGLVFVGTTQAQDNGTEQSCTDADITRILSWTVEHLHAVEDADSTAQYQALLDVNAALDALESACAGVGGVAAYRPAFGIDYAHPQLYITQGDQSHITDPSVLDELRTDTPSLAHLEQIFQWMKANFEHYSAGGKTIGVVTVDELLAERRLGGCHDTGLVFAAIARELGYPAVMVRTVSIAWIGQYQANENKGFVGHVFVEVFLDGRWILIDSTGGHYVAEGYDPTNPVIPLTGNIAGTTEELYGFMAERKGVDTWGFGIHSPAESNQSMRDFGDQADLDAIQYPAYTFERFSRSPN